jgi:hypothetical protein
MCSKELLNSGQVTEGAPILEVLCTADLGIEESRTKVLIEEEQFVSYLLEDKLDALSAIVFGVDLGKELSAEKAESVDKFEVAVLGRYIVFVVLIFLCKGGRIFLLLSLATLGKLLFLNFQLSLALVEQKHERHGK